MAHEKQIEIRWRDVDAFGHVNNSVYATYLEECRDELAERALAGVGDPWDFVLARVAIDFRRELKQEDDAIVVRCAVGRIGNSSITFREEIRTTGGELAAEAEAVIVARDPATGRSRALTEAERAGFTSTGVEEQ
jgi:acyl-CoA thioester hydrolase